jgi:hypothetical protein
MAAKKGSPFGKKKAPPFNGTKPKVGKKGMGFAAATKSVQAQGQSKKAAQKIIAAGARNASPAAKKANPNLKKVGARKKKAKAR